MVNIKIQLFATVFLFILSACSTAQQKRSTSSVEIQKEFASLPAGGRVSLHGMVVYGKGQYFIEHIPMLNHHHEFQIIVSVALKDKSGKVVTNDFSNEGFTLKPATNFSLNDYLSGRLTKFEGAIHKGSFEQGGKIVPGLERINVEVIDFKLARQLPAESAVPSFETTDQTNIYESNLIIPNNNIQLIRNKSKNKTLWCVAGPDFFDPCP